VFHETFLASVLRVRGLAQGRGSGPVRARAVTAPISEPGRAVSPVFLDESGRRWRRIRLMGIALGVLTSLAAAAVVVGLLIPPLPPSLPLAERPLGRTPHLAVNRAQRERLAKRLQLWFELRRHHQLPALKPSLLPIKSRRAGQKTAPPGEPIIAGFYVNWDDNSFASLTEHMDDLDWVVCEWGFVARGGDSLRLGIDRRVPFVMAQRYRDERLRPRLFLMVENYDSTAARKWDPAPLRHLLETPAARARAIGQLRDAVVRYGLSGVTLDFEEVPPSMTELVVAFARDLKTALAPAHGLVTQAVSFNDTDRQIARYAAVNDKLFLMLYDEHYGKGDPGPVASQGWYVRTARHLLRIVPPTKAILALGAYGYDWNDGDPASSGQGLTFQEMMGAVREAQRLGMPASLHFDTLALNPYATWRDPDSTDHVAWYLDAVTAYNQILAGEALGAAGHAIWRLGSEDPAIWAVLGRRGIDAPAQYLSTIPPGYDPEFYPAGSTGEILELTARPTAGRRTIRVDPVTRLIADEHVTRYATPYIIHRFGDRKHRVALTFDDGPDGRWTGPILDTLRSRHAPATFFVVGENVEAHIPLVRRLWAEGHEIGNHTFTHPNLGLPSPHIEKLTKLQLDATERLLEAILDRRTAFFRPPYFGDAEPTTPDELVPVGIASDRGYLTIGLRIDSEDWRQPGVQAIIDTVLAQHDRGNVILLHDGGGNRSQTVAALGPLIDSLRARGDTLVTVSELVGIPREMAMPPLPPRSRLERLGDLAFFGGIGVVEWVLYWTFLAAVVLGIARLVFITTLAVIQRVRRHQDPRAPITYAPSVSIIVPAYREERVIVPTIRSLVTQQYPGPLEVVVVDDGSPDRTYDVACAAFGDHPRVSIHRKPNGGKASALNFGLERARGEIVICLDADTIFAPDTVARLVEPLGDPRVGAVAGNAKVGNRINLVTRWQAVEYVTSQNLDRRAFSLLDCITVVPGAVGAWRKSLVEAAGGFREDTLAEDQDLTLAIRRRGHSIAYADAAVGYTEAPDSLRALARQRFRWCFGTLQCVWKHRAVLGRLRYGSLGLVALPNVLLFQLFFPFVSPIADAMFLWSLVSVWLIRQQHGATYALTSLEQVLAYYAVFLLVDWLAAIAAFLLEPGEDRSLTWLVVLQRFAYRQVMYWVVMRSVIAALRGRVVGWGKLERKASVQAAQLGAAGVGVGGAAGA
jgi:cellulose synthase/poly-beta-1,6-N-acetylglucosamine synthase-like glycosyltransferase/peptidoglycan/xylan/chitin deacetylase (PgdA/CDA1 family)/spore germination protein YaaH